MLMSPAQSACFLPNVSHVVLHDVRLRSCGCEERAKLSLSQENAIHLETRSQIPVSVAS